MNVYQWCSNFDTDLGVKNNIFLCSLTTTQTFPSLLYLYSLGQNYMLDNEAIAKRVNWAYGLPFSFNFFLKRKNNSISQA